MHRHRVSQNGGLHVLRKEKFFFRPRPRELGDLEVQDLVRLFEDPCGLGVVRREGLPHPNMLGSLSWKENC